MNRLSTVMAVVAIVAVVAVGGLFFINRPNQAVVGAPSPSPSPSAAGASPAAAGLVPPELRYRWIGEPREVAGRGVSSRTGLNFSQDAYYLSGTEYVTSGLMNSHAALTGPGKITLTTALGSDPLCAEGDTGTYAYVLSPGSTRMTMTTISEDCAARATAVSGDWFRVACKITNGGCWGELEAGTYPSQYVAPRLDPGAPWSVPFGEFTYTVPDGWANSEDWPDTFVLMPAEDYAKTTSAGAVPGTFHGIYIWTQPAAANQPDTCANDERTDVARTPEGLAEFIGSLPSVEATAPTPITIDGHQGVWMDVAVAADWTKPCPDTSMPTAVFMTKASGGANGWSWGIGGTERQRLILLDLDGHTVLIGIDSTYPDRFDDLVTQAMPIVESLHFK